MTTETVARENGMPWGSRWQHERRRTTYKVICTGLIEADLTACVVYQADVDGSVWVRPFAEFMDGRFVRLDAEAGALNLGDLLDAAIGCAALAVLLIVLLGVTP